MKDVKINLVSTVETDGESEVFELSTSGKLGVKGNMTVLIYDESDAIGISGVKTTLSVTDNKVVMQRSGALSGRLVIVKDTRQMCVLDTVQGAMSFGIYGENVKSTLDELGGCLDMTYTIDVQNNLVSRNNIKVSAKLAQL